MVINIYELIGILISVILAIFLLWIFTKKLQRKLSKWDELAKEFPWNGIFPESEFFRRCGGTVGTVLFNRKNGYLSVGFENDGIIISANQKSWPFLCVPWKRIRSAVKYPFHSKYVAKIEIDNNIPLTFYLQDKGLQMFETWHKVETKSVQDLLDSKRSKYKSAG